MTLDLLQVNTVQIDHQKSQLAMPRCQAPRTQTEVAACRAMTPMPPDAQTKVASAHNLKPPVGVPRHLWGHNTCPAELSMGPDVF
jgi:hypothetical protein